METLIMPAALPVLREACVMPALVSTDFGEEAREQNEIIRVPLPQDLGTADDMDPVNGSASTALGDAKVDITLDTWVYKQFEMSDHEMATTITGGVLPSAVDAALKALANRVNSDLWQLYRDTPYNSGTAGVTPADSSAIADVRLVLQKNLVPYGNRYLTFNPDAEASFLIDFKDAYKFGSTAALQEAALGRLYGFDTYSDQMAPYHTFGTFANGSPVVNAGGSGQHTTAGATVLNVKGGSASETLVYGDTFTIAGVNDQFNKPMVFAVGPNPNAVDGQTWTAASGVITGMAVYPAIPSAVADGSAITVTKPSSGSQYAINLAFHRQSMMFAARPLGSERSENSTISVQSDPVTGIPLRLETWRSPQTAKRIWRFDILYGVKTLRPEMMARMLG
jgi:hypothetical protein